MYWLYRSRCGSRNCKVICLILDQLLLLLICSCSKWTEAQFISNENLSADLKQNHKVVIKRESECNASETVEPSIAYDLHMELDHRDNRCRDDQSRLRTGFYCSYTFHTSNAFDMLGNALCVDVRDVPASLQAICQLRLEVLDHKGKLLKDIYCNSQLPTGQPYYLCADRTLSLRLLVRDHVPICHGQNAVLDLMMMNSLDMGRILIKPSIPTYMPRSGTCHASLSSRGKPYIIKIDTDSFLERHCELKVTHSPFQGRVQGCATLAYLSQDHECDVKIQLIHSGKSLVFINVPNGWEQYGQVDVPHCVRGSFDGTNPIVLSIYMGGAGYGGSICKGKFAVLMNFTQINEPGGDEEDKRNETDYLRHLYMAVFISLISVCLLILGLTCICCLRMRSKRTRRSIRRRRSQSSANQNSAFQASPAEVPIPSISWSSNEPGQILGLPSYDDAVGQNRETSSDPTKDDLPPAYDSVYPHPT